VDDVVRRIAILVQSSAGARVDDTLRRIAILAQAETTRS
jgi:hypothetical protein